MKKKNKEGRKFGHKPSLETRKKLSFAHRGAKNHEWKGDNVSYRGLHAWVVKNYGQPTTCEHCQTGNLFGRKINWANKSREYKRDREDWLRLCSKCHGIFDKGNKGKGRLKANA